MYTTHGIIFLLHELTQHIEIVLHGKIIYFVPEEECYSTIYNTNLPAKKCFMFVILKRQTPELCSIYTTYILAEYYCTRIYALEVLTQTQRCLSYSNTFLKSCK